MSKKYLFMGIWHVGQRMGKSAEIATVSEETAAYWSSSDEKI